jgi:hypothetical protein
VEKGTCGPIYLENIFCYVKFKNTRYLLDEVNKGGVNMLIQVSYLDNRYDYLKDFQLDRLLELRQVAGFRRSSGWVKVGVDPVREHRRNYAYYGPERRTGSAGVRSN